jgi:hypothetical protein
MEDWAIGQSIRSRWSDLDRAIVWGVEELMGDHALSDVTWGTLSRSWNETQMIELPGLAGAYALTNQTRSAAAARRMV